MDVFGKPYWSRLQVELWVCTRSRDAVRLAAYHPAAYRFADLSLGPDDEPFDDENELIGTAICSYGCVCPFDDARRKVMVAVSEGTLRAHSDQEGEFFESAFVQRLWPAEDKRNKGGRPETPYKETVIEKTVAWLDDEGEAPQSETIKSMERLISQIDDQGGPSETTLKNWAKEAHKRFRARRSQTKDEGPETKGQNLSF